MKIVNIAIDGPAGAGKSTVAKAVARKLGFAYLDTGAMYRAIALKAVRLGIAPSDSQKVRGFLPGTAVDIRYSAAEQSVWLDGEDVSGEIRRHEISKAASDISKIPEVRLKLVELQRRIASKCSVVVDGRDIASYVLPNADAKFYLTASPEIRARRRYDELIAKGEKAEYDAVLKDVVDRDDNDMHRSFAPLVKVPDAIEVDSTEMTVEEVVDYIVKRSR